jgi:hypothetical protein
MDSSESSGEDVHEMIVQYVTEVSSKDKQVSSEVTEVVSEGRKKVSSEAPCEDKVVQRDICEADNKVDKNVKVESYKRAGPWTSIFRIEREIYRI